MLPISIRLTSSMILANTWTALWRPDAGTSSAVSIEVW